MVIEKNRTIPEGSISGHAIFLMPYVDKLGSSMKSTKAFSTMLAQVGVRLADLRVKKGYNTIKEFTQKYGLPEIQYWRMEKGKANITLKSLVKVLNIHNIGLQDFFCLVTEEKMAA